MGNEDVGEAKFALQPFEQADHLRLNGHIQRSRGFIKHQKIGMERQRPGNAHALPLAAGELMGVALR